MKKCGKKSKDIAKQRPISDKSKKLVECLKRLGKGVVEQPNIYTTEKNNRSSFLRMNLPRIEKSEDSISQTLDLRRQRCQTSENFTKKFLFKAKSFKHQGYLDLLRMRSNFNAVKFEAL